MLLTNILSCIAIAIGTAILLRPLGTIRRFYRFIMRRRKAAPVESAEVAEPEEGGKNPEIGNPWEITGETEEAWTTRWAAEKADDRYWRNAPFDRTVDEEKWKGNSDNSSAYRDLIVNGLLQTVGLKMTSSTRYCGVCFNTGLVGGLDGICELSGAERAKKCEACGLYNENVRYAYKSTRYQGGDSSEEHDARWTQLDPEDRKAQVIENLGDYYSHPVGISPWNLDRISGPEALKRVLIALSAQSQKWFIARELQWHEWYGSDYPTYKNRLNISSVLLYQLLDMLAELDFVEVRELADREVEDTPAQTAYRITKKGVTTAAIFHD